MNPKLVPDLPPGLVYVCDADPAIARLRRGKGFAYRQHDGRMVSQANELQRIRKLAIPPYIHPRVLELAAMACAKREDAQQWLARAEKRRAPKGSSGLPMAERRLLAFLALAERRLVG